jgi:hypothetical protein
MGNIKSRPAKRTVRQSKIRADNTRLVLSWTSDGAIRAAFAGPEFIATGATPSKSGPGPLPFKRAPALLDEIRRRNEQGKPVEAAIWAVYDVESACDARLAVEVFRPLPPAIRRIRRYEDLRPTALDLEASGPKNEADWWRIDGEIEVPEDDRTGERGIPGSPLVLIRQVRGDLIRVLRRVRVEMKERRERGQANAGWQGRPLKYDVSKEMREHIHMLSDKGLSPSEIVAEVRGWSAGKISKEVVRSVLQKRARTVSVQDPD